MLFSQWLFSLLFLYKAGPFAQAWHYPQQAEPLTSITNQENPHKLVLGQFNTDIFSTEVPSSQMTRT